MQWTKFSWVKVTGLVLIVAIISLYAFFEFFREGEGLEKTAGGAEIELSGTAKVERYDFDQKGIEGWKTIDGQWAVEEMAGAPSGKRVLILRPQGSDFNVIV